MYNKYFTMKRSELKEAIKAEIKSVLSEEITEAKFIKFKGDSDDNKMEVEAEREMNTPDGELKVYTVKTDDGVQSYTADQVELVEGNLNENEGQRAMTEFIKVVEKAPNSEEIFKKFENVINSIIPGAIKEVYQTRSKMEQIVNLFQDMMDDEYDGQDYRKVLNMVLKAIDDDYKAAEREGEKFSRIREDEMTDAEKKKAAEKDAKKEKDFANKQKAVDKLKKELADNKDELVKIAKISRNERTKAQQNLLDDMAKKTKELKKLKRVEI